MSEITLTALVLLPSPDAPFDRVGAVCAECLDLADVKANRPAPAPDATKAAAWADIEGKLEVCDFVMVDLTPVNAAGTIDNGLLIQATIARFAHRKPVIVLHRGELELPLGWHAWSDSFPYEDGDDGLKALKKALNKRLVTLVSEIEDSLIDGGGRPTAASGSPRASATPEAPPVSDDPDEAARMKAVLRERFRKRLGGDVDEADRKPDDVDVRPAGPMAPGALAGTTAGAASAGSRPQQPQGAPPGARKSQRPEDELAEEVTEEKKKSRLLELQEKLKRNEAAAAAEKAKAEEEGGEDDLGFDLNIDLDGDAPVKVTSGLSSKVRAGEMMAEQVKPEKPKADSDDDDDDDDDDDFELDASDIDILKDIRAGDRKKKKKRKKKTGARPNPAAAGAAPAPVKKEAAGPPKDSRSGLGMIVDKRTGQRLELRKPELRIGRVAGRNDVVLTEGQVSSSHCKIMRKDDAYFIIDMGSTNGTYVNDEMVSSKQAHRLRDDDRIIIAKTKETPNGAREFVFNQHP